MIKIDTRVTVETVEIIKETAKDNGRSFCGEIRYALEQHYKEQESRGKLYPLEITDAHYKTLPNGSKTLVPNEK